MGLIRNIVKKVILEEESSSIKISKNKIFFLLCGIMFLSFYELSAVKYKQATGEAGSNLNSLFNPKVEFKEAKEGCEEEYVEVIVQNFSGELNLPKQLYSDFCRINRPMYSSEAKYEFAELQNKETFRVKYKNEGKYQKIFHIGDVGYKKEVSTTFNTSEIIDNCLIKTFNTYCNMPRLKNGTYKVELTVDSDNQVLTINNLKKI